MIYKSWLASKNVSNKDKARINEMNKFEKDKAFSSLLNFGTAGLRGIMDVGTNCINVYTVSHVSQAIADFMQKHNQKSIVLACDTRNNSKLFLDTAINIFLLNNLSVFVFDSIVPISLLSYSVRYLGCDFGVYITASHNPKEYNGYKVFDHTGCQINETIAEEINQYRDNIDILKKYETANKTAKIVDNSVKKAFIREIKNCKIHNCNNINITYSGLFGSGNNFVDKVLNSLGFDVHVVESQSEYNGDFPGLKTPNPEDESTFEEALKVADKHKSDLIIATDPDADRIGVMVYHNGEYIRLSGNQVGVLLANYITKYKKAKKACVVFSDVSTNMAKDICKKNKANTIIVPTGFKNIGAKINNKKDEFVFGFEESCGYLVGPYIRDKDSVGAAVLIAEMAAFYKNKNMTLIDELYKLYERHGYHMEKTFSIFVNRPLSLLDMVHLITDGSIGFTNLNLTANMLFFDFKNKCSLFFRMSGTEPKMKAYLKVVSDREEESLNLLEEYSKIVEKVREKLENKLC
jgi:phosphoglucomutase